MIFCIRSHKLKGICGSIQYISLLYAGYKKLYFIIDDIVFQQNIDVFVAIFGINHRSGPILVEKGISFYINIFLFGYIRMATEIIQPGDHLPVRQVAPITEQETKGKVLYKIAHNPTIIS